MGIRFEGQVAEKCAPHVVQSVERGDGPDELELDLDGRLECADPRGEFLEVGLAEDDLGLNLGMYGSSSRS